MTSLDISIDSDYFLSADSDESDSDSFISTPALADALESNFSVVSRNFNAVHINAQSIPAHFPDLLASFDCKDIHAILVSESCLKPCLSSNSYSLPGFRLLRNDRTCGGGGGVAIYLREYISFTIIDKSPQPPQHDAGEHLFIEISLNHQKLLLGVYYCPSLRINFFSSFESIVEKFVTSYSHIIIMGDFNTCLLKKDSRSSSFLDVLGSCNLTVLPLSATHHFPNTTPSLLDLIIVSSSPHVAKHGQCAADSFSYHDLIFLSYKIRPPKAKPKILRQRNFSDMKLDMLRADAMAIDWLPLFESNSMDDKVDIFHNEIIKLYDLHAPVRSVKMKHLPSPWLTPSIKALIAKKSAAKTKHKRQPTAKNWENYLSIRNHCNRMCRKAQRQHVHESVQNGDPGRVWKFLRTFGVGKSRQNTVPPDIDFELLNQYFTASPLFNRTIKAKTLNRISSIPTPNYDPFVFNEITDCDIKKSVLSITSNAVGSDCISRKMILPILDAILPVLSHLLNYSLSSRTFPTCWKDAEIIPLPKKPNATSFSEFRPISLLPFLSKVLERLVNGQISAFLSKNYLLNPYQSGFRPGHSTTTALVNITEDIRLGMECGNLTVVSLLDFSSAFNTVDFDVLLAIMRSINISPVVIEWFQTYLSGRRQRIKIDDATSSWCITAAGVPQGGVLSPLLFTIFISTVSSNLLSSYHLYADDLQIYSQAPLGQLSEAINHVNADLNRIAEWSADYGLCLNPIKTQLIIIGSSNFISRIDWSNLPQMVLDGTAIPYSKKVKNLGIIIDETLSWNPQLQEVSRKIFASMGSLRRLRNLLPTATKIALAQSLLLPILDYADASYTNLTEDQLNRLERLQNYCIRFIFGIRKYDHVSIFRTKLKWLPIRFRRNAHILSLLYSILFNIQTPLYLKKRFQFSDTHSGFLRTSRKLLLKMPAHSTDYLGRSFTVQAIRLWNALPLTIRSAKSLHKFKSLVREYYLSQ